MQNFIVRHKHLSKTEEEKEFFWVRREELNQVYQLHQIDPHLTKQVIWIKSKTEWLNRLLERKNNKQEYLRMKLIMK